MKPAEICSVVLGADFGYADKVMTTIKSVSSHNRNMRFYILNTDFPQEWFNQLRPKLMQLGSEIIDVKVDVIDEGVTTANHISLATYLRFYIPEMIPENRVLYLDSDIVVTNDIRHLFDIDLQGKPIAAVNDLFIQSDIKWLGLSVKETLNAGVILFDNKYCRENEMTKLFIQTLRDYKDKIYLGDQTVFNIVFQNNWLNLGVNYNCLLTAMGFDDEMGGHNIGEITKNNLPTILHYCTVEKPWKQQCWVQCKSLWWFYCGLEWNDIIKGVVLPDFEYVTDFLILTRLGDFEQLETLVQKFPERLFSIVARTNFSEKAIKLTKYSNVRMYPNAHNFVIEHLKSSAKVYLDINYGLEFDCIIDDMHNSCIPVFAFETTNKDKNNRSHVFKINEINQMIEVIKCII